MDEAELAKAINHSTRRLVSKQRKWYRKHFGESSRVVLGGDSKKNNFLGQGRARLTKWGKNLR